MIYQQLAAMQAQLSAAIAEIRAKHHHAGTKGQLAEGALRAVIRSLVPVFKQVGHGEVVDREGNRSGQTDVVITNEHHALISDPEAANTFFIEEVACAGEVKMSLGSDDLDDALRNCSKFKQLTPFIASGAVIETEFEEDVHRFVEKRPYFLFCYESHLTLQRIAQALSEFSSLPGNWPLYRQLDAVFVLGRGVVVNFGRGQGALRFLEQGSALPVHGVHAIETDAVLAELVRWLHVVMIKLTMPVSGVLAHLDRGPNARNGYGFLDRQMGDDIPWDGE